MDSRGASKADRVVAQRIASEKREAEERRERQIGAQNVVLDPIRREIRNEVPRALHRLEAKGFPDGQMLRIYNPNPRLFRKEQSPWKAAWRIAEHLTEFKGDRFPTTKWLLADGRITGSSGEVDLDAIISESLLRAMLRGLEQLAPSQAAQRADERVDESCELENAARAFAAKHGGYPCKDDNGSWLILKPRGVGRNLAWRMPSQRPFCASSIQWTEPLTWKLLSARRATARP